MSEVHDYLGRLEVKIPWSPSTSRLDVELELIRENCDMYFRRMYVLRTQVSMYLVQTITTDPPHVPPPDSVPLTGMYLVRTHVHRYILYLDTYVLPYVLIDRPPVSKPLEASRSTFRTYVLGTNSSVTLVQTVHPVFSSLFQ